MSDEQTIELTAALPNRSGSIAKLAGALAKAQAEMEGAAKDATNPHFRSKYADLASVRDACKPLSKHGIAVLQPTRADGNRVTVTTLLIHDSGEWISEDLTLTAQQETPQAVGSAITYGRRYGLAAMVGIAPEDDDGEAAEGRAVHPQAAANRREAERHPEPLPDDERVAAMRGAARGLPTPAISDAQAKRFYAIAKGAGWTDDSLKEWLKDGYGIESSRAIPRSRYDEICKQAEAGPLAAAGRAQ